MGRKRKTAVFAPGYDAWLEAVRARIRNLRAERGLSVRAAAELVGVSFANLNKIETGATREPTLGAVWDIAAGYGVPFEHLLCGRKKSGKKPATGC